MNPRTLVIVASDPRASHRPAEAVRIAAGVAAWKKTDVRLYLHGEAVRAVGEWVDDLVDEDNFTRYLPILGDLGHPIAVEAGSPLIAGLGAPPLPIQEVSPAEVRRMISESRQVLRF